MNSSNYMSNIDVRRTFTRDQMVSMGRDECLIENMTNLKPEQSRLLADFVRYYLNSDRRYVDFKWNEEQTCTINDFLRTACKYIFEDVANGHPPFQDLYDKWDRDGNLHHTDE